MENLNFWSKLFILNSYSIVEASAEIRENGYEKNKVLTSIHMKF